MLILLAWRRRSVAPPRVESNVKSTPVAECSHECLQLKVGLVSECESVLVRSGGHSVAEAAVPEDPAADGEHNARKCRENGEDDRQAACDDPATETESHGQAEHPWPGDEIAADASNIGEKAQSSSTVVQNSYDAPYV